MKLPPALRHRDFRVLLVGSVLTRIGEYIKLVVQSWLVWELTGSAFYLGVIGFCEFGPRLLFGLLGGVLVDRVDRRRLMISTQIVTTAQSVIFTILVLTGTAQFWHIVTLVLIFAVANSFFTTANQAIICSLVPQEAVVSALAMNSAGHNLTKIIGPSIGGILITLIGSGSSLIICVFTSIAMLVCLAIVHGPTFTPPLMVGSLLDEVAEGYRYVRHHRRIRTTILVTYFNAFAGTAYIQLLPVFAGRILEVGSSGYGFLMAAPGIGALAGSLLIASIARLERKRRILLGSSWIYAGSLFLFAMSRSMIVSLLLLTVVGCMQMTFRVIARAVIQEDTPPHLLGRAMSIFLLDRGFTSLGAIFLGSMATLLGASPAVALGALICGVSTWVIPRTNADSNEKKNGPSLS